MWIDDEVMRECGSSLVTNIFVPQKPMVVLGSSNKGATEVQVANCEADQVPVLKRYGGGGTVYLYSGCVVVTIGCWVADYYDNDQYFIRLNDAVIHSLSLGYSAFSDLSQKGISDIAFHERKVAGTSLFRSRNYLLYQASIIVDLDIDGINRYLQHPSKEPDYRRARKHAEFLTSLGNICPVTPNQVESVLKDHLGDAIKDKLSDKLIEPIEQHIPNLLNRIKRHG